MKSWLVILAPMALSWHFLDIASGNGFEGVFLPLVFAVCLILCLIKLTLALGPRDSRRSGSGGDGGFNVDTDSGCDGGD